MTVAEAVAILIAVVSALVSILSWRAARDSADATKKYATATERSVTIQSREADAAAEARRRQQTADVIPLYWESSSSKQYRGLVIRNNGPAVATQIKAYDMWDSGEVRKWLWPALAAGETVGLAENELRVSDEGEMEHISKPAIFSGRSCSRLEWTNSDGTQGIADWRSIHHM